MTKLRMLGARIGTLDTRRVKPPPKEVEPFYVSAAWRALMDRITGSRGRRCEDPSCKTPRGPWQVIYGDHIVERRDGGADLDQNNIMLRCGPCHGRKTATERGRRARSSPST